MKFFILIISFFFISNFLYSQENEKNDTLIVEYAESSDRFNFVELPYEKLESTHHYRPIGKRRLPWARSGNIGLPLHSYEILNQNFSINSHLGGFQPYVLTQDSVYYYKMSRPFTQLVYASGAEEEQFFKAFHSQNFGDGLNISFRYDRITSEGFFLKQLTNHTRFHTTYNLESRNRRFRSHGNFIISNLEAQENGGVIANTNDNPDDNTVLLDINLRDAQNRMRSQELFFSNFYDVWKTDSSNTRITLNYSIRYAKSYRNYYDNLNEEEQNYFSSYYLDETESADSSFVGLLSHQLSFLAFNNRLKFGLEDRSYHYYQNRLTDVVFGSQLIHISTKDSLWGNYIEATFTKGISGFEKDEVLAEIKVRFPKILSFSTEAYLNISENQADYFLQRQRVNHFVYDQPLTTSKARRIGGKIIEEKTNVLFKFEIAQLQDWIYYDSLVLPTQENEKIEIIRMEISKKFEFLKHFHFLNRIIYQKTSNKEILPLPELYSYHSLYYDNLFFKNSLGVQIGADLYYLGTYNGYAYNPAMAQFHLRNEQNNFGNVQQLDLFINLGISNAAKLFVKYENILMPSFSESSYRIQDYPIPGRVIKFGLSWRMIN